MSDLSRPVPTKVVSAASRDLAARVLVAQAARALLVVSIFSIFRRMGGDRRGLARICRSISPDPASFRDTRRGEHPREEETGWESCQARLLTGQ